MEMEWLKLVTGEDVNTARSIQAAMDKYFVDKEKDFDLTYREQKLKDERANHL